MIAVFGTGRNGSTLLCRLLDGAPGLYVHVPECNFLSAFDDLAARDWVRRETIQNARAAPLRRLDGAVPAERLLRFYAGHWEEIRNTALDQTGFSPAGPAPEDSLRGPKAWRVEDFPPAFLAAAGRWLFGDGPLDAALFKTIETPYVAAYHDRFADMRFIHLVRDPVATWASAKRTLIVRKRLPDWYLGGDSLRTMIDRRWLPHAEAIARFANSPRHRLVRYEDLVRDPAATIEGLCRWLDLAPPRAPCEQTVLGGLRPEAMLSYPSEPGVETPRAVVPDMAGAFAYDEVVSPRERAFIVARTYDRARALGYFEKLPRPDPAALRYAWLPPDRWDFRNARGAAGRARAALWYLRRRWYVWRALGTRAGPASPPAGAADGGQAE